MVIEKFLRQLIPNPAEHALIMKHFEASPLFLMSAMFHKRELYETAVALETEMLRKEHIDYENIVFPAGDKDQSFSIKDRVMEKSVPTADDPNLGKGDERVREKK